MKSAVAESCMLLPFSVPVVSDRTETRGAFHGTREKHTAERIVNLLGQVEVGVANGKSLPQTCKEAEIVEQTYYRWPKEFGGFSKEKSSKSTNADLYVALRELACECDADVARPIMAYFIGFPTGQHVLNVVEV